MKIAFITLGCKLNFAETATYERGFREAGLEIVPWREKADAYLINTCTVTATADGKSRNELRKVHRINPDAIIVVTGCYAQMKPEEVRAIEGVARVFTAEEKSTVVEKTLELLRPDTRGNACTEPFFGRGHALSPAAPVFAAYSTGERTRAFLKVQDGCDNFCRYCAVPYARGRSRSIRICEAVRMAEDIAAAGVKEVVLTGVNTGDFGRGTDETFLGLLQALDRVDGIERYRISSIEPNLLTEDIIDWIASGTKFQPHFHIPLQQGTDTILASMGRKYTTAFFAERIAYIRQKMEGPGKPLVFFGIDVMAGLPGETEELFRQEYRFLEELRPAFIHVFPYSKRPGTPAATMPGQVPENIKAQRVAELEGLSSRLHAAFVEANRGVREKVLFESKKEKDGSMGGYTGNYIRISRPWDESLVGRLSEVTI